MKSRGLGGESFHVVGASSGCREWLLLDAVSRLCSKKGATLLCIILLSRLLFIVGLCRHAQADPTSRNQTISGKLNLSVSNASKKSRTPMSDLYRNLVLDFVQAIAAEKGKKLVASAKKMPMPVAKVPNLLKITPPKGMESACLRIQQIVHRCVRFLTC